MENYLEIILKKALINYDKMNLKYKEVLDSKNYTINQEENIIYFPDLDKKFKYNILGYFDNDLKIWIWSWAIPNFKYNDLYIVKKLLDYGIKIDSDNKKGKSQYFIKSQLTSSRFIINNKNQMDIHLSLVRELLANFFDFTYTARKKNNVNSLNIYYILKDI